MTKAKEIVGLDCNGDALEWVREILRLRFDEVLALRDQALHSEDVEAVHDMRVATRRLRSALQDFTPLMREKPAKKVKANLRRIAGALGEARDADVAIIALEKLKEKTDEPPVKEGIDKLVEKRRQIRQEAQALLAETLADETVKDLQEHFEKSILKATTPKKSAELISFNAAGREAVSHSLNEFCDLSANIYKPFTDKPLHRLRLSAKRLRYAIELFTACWGKQIAPFAEEIGAMQSFLGEVHDADVWLESLSEHLQKHEKNNTAVNNADIWLLSKFVKKRTKNYREALKLWNKWQEKDFLEKLRTLVLKTN